MSKDQSVGLTIKVTIGVEVDVRTGVQYNEESIFVPIDQRVELIPDSFKRSMVEHIKTLSGYKVFEARLNHAIMMALDEMEGCSEHSEPYLSEQVKLIEAEVSDTHSDEIND